VNTADGSARQLSWFENYSGGEHISFSPDDKWLLVSTYRGAVVIDTETGSNKRFSELHHASSWWIRNGHLGLLTIGRGNANASRYDPYVVDFHDFMTGSTAEVVRIIPPERGSSQSLGIWRAVPSAQGALLVTMLIPDSVNTEKSYHTLTLLDLYTGALTPVVDIFVEPEHKLRRKQDNWSWNSPIPNTIIAPATMLLEGFTQVSTSDWPEFEEARFGAILCIEFGSPLLKVSM
jgi:hypothetical protein